MDKGTKKNIFHKNAAARKKSKLAAYLKLHNLNSLKLYIFNFISLRKFKFS
jgi:hypothetical protein